MVGRPTLVAPLLQIGLVGFGLVALLLAPREGSAILLVPLTPGAAAAMVPLAIDGAGTLVGRGPLPGSLVIRGNLDLAQTMIAHGVVPLSARAAGCGRETA